MFESLTLSELNTALANVKHLPTSEQEALYGLIEKAIHERTLENCRNNFLDFVRYVWPGFICGPHHEIMAAEFQRLASGEEKRLTVSLPPRSGKSMLTAVYFPAWFLGKYPDKKILQASHKAELATGFGRQVRELFGDPRFQEVFPGVTLRADNKAAGRWGTNKGGSYLAAGVGAGLAGFGADLALLDDVHNEQDAISGIYDPEVYNKVYEWYLTGPRQRLQPGARVAVIGTRWSKIDLIGRLLEDANSKGGDKWKEIRFPALLNNDTESYWPSYWPVGELLATKRAIVATGSLWRWNSQYQQALCLSTPIPTPSGWTTMEEISVGDYVIGSDGKPVEVTWKSPNYEDRPCYRVYSDDGAEVIADENHLWTVKTGRNDAKFQIRTTKWLANRELKKEAKGIPPRRPRPPEIPPWTLPEVELPVDPYILGVWIGDGDRGSGTINSSETDQIWLREEFHRCGIQTTTRSDPQAFGTIGLRAKLRSAGVLMHKHIPDIYMRASESQRLSLLQGLMDTDGTCSEAGECYFAQVNEEVARSVCELVVSLGGKPRMRRAVTHTRAPGSKAAHNCYHWRVHFYLLNAFRMPRKLARCRARKTKIGRFLRFTKVAPHTVACIRVKNEDGIFLAGLGCLPTHNCPTSEEGALIKSNWWNFWDGRPPPCDYVIQAWDTASRTTQRSNYSVCTTWGVFYNESTGTSNIILLDCWRDKLEFPDLKRQALSLYKEWEPDSCVIEQKSAGEALITEFRRMGLFVEDYTPTRGDGDKVARVNAVTDIFASGCVWMLNRDWSSDVLDECQAFPMGANDDIVDTVAMALSRFRRGNFIKLESDEEDDRADVYKKAAYY